MIHVVTRLTRLRFTEGERWPWWKGFAWNDDMRQYSVALPIPFNIVVGVARRLWLFLRSPPFFYGDGRLERYWTERGRELQRYEDEMERASK